MKIKRILYFTFVCIVLLCNSYAYAQIKKDTLSTRQVDTSKKITKKNIRPDSVTIFKRPAVGKIDSVRKNKPDSFQAIQTIKPQATLLSDSNRIDTIKIITEKEAAAPIKFRSITDDLLYNNRLINIKDKAVYFIEIPRTTTGKEFLFYAIGILLLALGIFKTFYRSYFNNLFRVFFNTSLRQTQLADQLLQAKLPSFILNIFFTISAGIYIWLLFTHFHPPRLVSNRLLLPFCILSVALLYFIKYCLLKFMGWISDVRQATDNYIFVIFLVNKITGIILVPFIILLAFSIPAWIHSIATISLLVVGLFFLSRYVKSYGVVENKIPLNPFHFIIYIVGVEIIPLLIIYKVAVDYLI
jgi:hypothetical protein